MTQEKYETSKRQKHRQKLSLLRLNPTQENRRLNKNNKLKEKGMDSVPETIRKRVWTNLENLETW